MKWVMGIVLLLSALSVSDVSHAGYAEGNQFSAGNTNAAPAADAYGQIVRAFLNELLGGEDAVNNVFKVESRWTNIPTGTTTAMFAADIAIKNAPGLVHAITCYSDATATAGTIALRDNTAAGAGDILWSFDVLAIAYTTPFTVVLDVPFVVGLYADFTTTADVKCMVKYR